MENPSNPINVIEETLEQKITRLERENAELRKEIIEVKKDAYFDNLTGLIRRNLFEQEVEKYFPNKNESSGVEIENQRKKIEMPPVSLVFFNIDHFKNVNDTYGHGAGDAVLERVAQTIKENIRDIDLVARWGGEEIVLAVIGADEKVATDRADFIREKISQIDFSDIQNLSKDPNFKGVTISAGVASSLDLNNFEDCLEAADRAMYKSKENGRNRVTAHSNMPAKNTGEVLAD